MANTMVDLVKLYSIVAGPDFSEGSRLSWYQPKIIIPHKMMRSLHGIKIGVDYDWLKSADDEIISIFHKCLEKLKNDGAEIVPISLPDPHNRDVAHIFCFVAEMLPAINHHLNERILDDGNYI